MPVKTKAPKSKIKVEEVSEEPVEAKKEDVPEVEEKPAVKVVAEEPPKVTSFSQLDTMKSGEDTPVEAPKESVLTPPTSTEVEEKKASETGPHVETPAEESKTAMSSEDVKKWLSEVRPEVSKDIEKGGRPNFKLVLAMVIVFLILGALAGGVYYYKNSLNQPETKLSEKEEALVTSTQTPTPAAEVKLETLSVSVLNGSGVKGEAARVKQMLTEAGFSEEKVSAGNADNSNYEKTSISTKKDLPQSVYTKLEEVLGGNYTLEKSEESLEDSSSFDLIIIVGERK